MSFERATFESVVPYRAWDSRTGPGPAGKVAAGAPVDVLIAGAGSVPADATGVVLNVTVTEATVPSFLSVYPKGAANVSTSSLNFAAGQTVPNLVTVRIGSGGFVSFANQLGAVHVIADVMGFFRPHDHDDRYYTRAQVDALVAAVPAGPTGPQGTQGPPGQTGSPGPAGRGTELAEVSSDDVGGSTFVYPGFAADPLNVWLDLPGAGLTVNVPAGQTATLDLRFSASTRCTWSDVSHELSGRFLIDGNPVTPGPDGATVLGTYVKSTEFVMNLGVSMERVAKGMAPGAHTVQVQLYFVSHAERCEISNWVLTSQSFGS